MATNVTTIDPLLRPTDAAVLAGVKLRTLADWRAKKKGPRYVRLSSSAIRYRESDLREWIEARVVMHD